MHSSTDLSSRVTEGDAESAADRPTTSFLSLPTWTVEDVRHSRGSATGVRTYFVRARYESRPTGCPTCGGVLVGHGRRMRRIADMPHAGQPVVIEWQRQRYRCQPCGRTIAQSCPDVDERRRMTRRLRVHVERTAAREAFVSVAEDVGLSEACVRAVFRDYASRQLAEPYTPQAPVRLGIDEVYVNAKPRAIFVDLDTGRVIELLETRRQAAIARTLVALRERERVQVVTIDLHSPYRNAVRAALPMAKVVADRFHVAQLATKAVNRARIELSATLPLAQRRDLERHRSLFWRRADRLTESERILLLPSWFASLPALRIAYELGQQLLAVYDATGPEDARNRLDAWYAAATSVSATVPGFETLLATVRNWETEILNFFETDGASNAVTEAANRQLRDLERIGRGYRFASLRAKALLREPRRPRLRHRRPSLSHPRRCG